MNTRSPSGPILSQSEGTPLTPRGRGLHLQRVLRSLLACVIPLTTLACAGSPPPRVQEAPKQARKPDEAPPTHQAPYHVAPPPAYGNKIVWNTAQPSPAPALSISEPSVEPPFRSPSERGSQSAPRQPARTDRGHRG